MLRRRSASAAEFHCNGSLLFLVLSKIATVEMGKDDAEDGERVHSETSYVGSVVMCVCVCVCVPLVLIQNQGTAASSTTICSLGLYS